MRRRWGIRIGSSCVLVAGVYAGLELFDYEPRLAPLVLLSVLCLAVGWLVVDVLVDLGPGWTVSIEPPVSRSGDDQRLSTFVRVLENHLASAVPNANVRDELAQIADRRLMHRYGERIGDPAARDRLGPELLSVLEGPPRRLDVTDIDRIVRHIEEL